MALPLNAIHTLYIFRIVSPNSTHTTTWISKPSPCTHAGFSIKTEMRILHLGCYMWKPHFPPLFHIPGLGATFLVCKEKEESNEIFDNKQAPVSFGLPQLPFVFCAFVCTKGQRLSSVKWNYKTSFLKQNWKNSGMFLDSKFMGITKVQEHLSRVRDTQVRPLHSSFLVLTNQMSFKIPGSSVCIGWYLYQQYPITSCLLT